jgi:hypothetical protein
MERRVMVTFYIGGGAWDPDACTAALGLQPTRIRRRGSVARAGGPPARQNGWSIDTEWEDSDTTDAVLVRLLDRLWEHRFAIRRFCEENRAGCAFVAVVEILEERPVYELTRATIARMSEFGADFSLDIYDLREGQTLSQ